jgi:hypothetical protein
MAEGEKQIVVAYLGPEASYTHQVCGFVCLVLCDLGICSILDVFSLL